MNEREILFLAMGVLRRVQWIGSGEAAYCPVCMCYRKFGGHSETCSLNIAIREFEKRDGESVGS